jgi:methylenetetrahydrofolate reductase (NADPH)
MKKSFQSIGRGLQPSSIIRSTATPLIKTTTQLSESASTPRTPRFNVLFFCPRNEDHFKKFVSTYPRLIKSEPSIESVSVTDVAHNPEYSERAIRMLIDQGISPDKIIPHIAIIARSKEENDKKIRTFREMGIKTIFVVRGNALVIGKGEEYMKHPQGYDNPSQLIRRVKEKLAPEMQILVAGYPEKHPLAKNYDEDLDELQKKVEAGANGVILQHSFRNEILEGFLEECDKRGMNLPFVPSIMPIGNPKYLIAFSKEAGVTVPVEVFELLFSKEGSTTKDGSIRDSEIERLAVDYTANQIQELHNLRLPNVQRFNTYTANRPDFLQRVLDQLKIKQQNASQEKDPRGGGRG